MQCITGADPGTFDWVGGGGGVQTLFQKRLLNFFVVNYFSPITSTPPHLHTPSYQMRLPINFLGQLKSRKILVHCTAVLLIG